MSQTTVRTDRASADDASRWQAVCHNDAAADGTFVYAVRTTGIYCRPSCRARRPLRANVEFFDTASAAEAAGYRACRRCRPQRVSDTDRVTEAVIAACRRLEHAQPPPGLAELARAANLSPAYFHRRFKQITGLTPHTYARACRDRVLRERLGQRTRVTAALYDAGFVSSGHFHAQANSALGMSATAYRNAGAGCTIRFAVGDCALGALLVAGTADGVCAISLGDDPDTLLRDLQNRFARAELIGGNAEYERHVARVVGFVEAPERGLNLPLDIRGTAFQQRVWQALRAIPVGETASYAEIARAIGAPQSARAVARACAANAHALAIPCHRVVRTGGGLSGYRWGVERKRVMLAREATGATEG